MEFAPSSTIKNWVFSSKIKNFYDEIFVRDKHLKSKFNESLSQNEIHTENKFTTTTGNQELNESCQVIKESWKYLQTYDIQNFKQKCMLMCHKNVPFEPTKEDYNHETQEHTSLKEKVKPEDQCVQVKTCHACGDFICDKQYVSIENLRFHEKCLKCFECERNLTVDKSCYFKFGRVYCKKDYFSLYQKAWCNFCKVRFSFGDKIFKLGDVNYHDNEKCMSCTECKTSLKKGDFCLVYKNNRLVCHACHIASNHDFQTEEISINKVQASFHKNSNYQASIQKNKRNEKSKIKRNRTSFKPDQLRQMKEYFKRNMNPDSKELRELAFETGLNKRVLQVWFQNSRAKHRKSFKKQQGVFEMGHEAQSSHHSHQPNYSIPVNIARWLESPEESPNSPNSVSDVDNLFLGFEKEKFNFHGEELNSDFNSISSDSNSFKKN